MKPCFVVYIDESGDEGFKFSKGSSEWFVISAAVTRAESDHKTLGLIDSFKSKAKIPAKNHVHYTGLKQPRRLLLAQTIATGRLRVVSVLAHKPSLLNTGLVEHPRLYFYLVRWLLERVSWLCRDAPKSDASAGCAARIVFSARCGTPYGDLVDYLVRLRTREQTSIHWPAIDVEAISVQPHRANKGLQIVDGVAGSLLSALELNDGRNECSCARALKPVTYAYRGVSYRRYGLKLLPDMSKEITSEARFAWYREAFPY